MSTKALEEARVRLYTRKDRTRLVLVLGAVVLLVFVFLGILAATGAPGLSFRGGTDPPAMRFLTYLGLGIAGFCGPYGFYAARRQKNIKQIERRLPEFLRDVAEAGRFGMTLAEAIVVASSGRSSTTTPTRAGNA